MILTGEANKDFNKYKKWYFRLLPRHIKYLIIFRWFNQYTDIAIDIQKWTGDGFDWAVTHENINNVYISQEIAGNRTKSFDLNILRCVERANNLYNELNNQL